MGRKRICYAICGLVLCLALSGCSKGAETVLELTKENALESQGGENELAEIIEIGEEANKRDQAVQQDGRTAIDAEVVSKDLSKWDGNKELVHAKFSSVTILNEGYEELKNALDAAFQISQEEVEKSYEELLAGYKALSDSGVQTEESWSQERTAQIIRSDSQIMSIFETEYGYSGGPHPNHWERGLNIEPKTGRRLSLKDVWIDYDEACRLLEEKLWEEYGDTMYEDWRETLHQMCYEDLSIDNCWIMDMEKICIYFSPYMLASYSAGTLSVTLPFEGNQALIKKEYLPSDGRFARRVYPDMPESLGEQKGEFSFSVERNEETMENRLVLSLKSPDGETQGEGVCYGIFYEAYLMATGDGRRYLYAEFLEENDYRRLYVFDLNGKAEKVGETENSFLDHIVSDPAQFTLYTRLDILGTYIGHKSFQVGSDGMPEPKSDEYKIGKQWGFDGYILTSKIPVPVWFGQGEEEKRQVLPAGTKFLLRSTDGDSFVEMELEDQRRCRVRIERQDWFSNIEGIGEDEYFEGILYVG